MLVRHAYIHHHNRFMHVSNRGAVYLPCWMQDPEKGLKQPSKKRKVKEKYSKLQRDEAGDRFVVLRGGDGNN